MSLPFWKMTHSNLWFAGSIFRTQCLDNIILGNMPLVALGRKKKNNTSVCVFPLERSDFPRLRPVLERQDEEGRCKCFPSLEKHTASSLVSRTVFWPVKTKESGIFLKLYRLPTLPESQFMKSKHSILRKWKLGVLAFGDSDPCGLGFSH